MAAAGMPEESTPPEGGQSGREKPQRPRPFAPAGWVVGLLLVFTMLMLLRQVGGQVREVSYSFFRKQVLAANVEAVEVTGNRIAGSFKKPPPAPNEPETGGTTPTAESEDSAADDEAAGERSGQEEPAADSPASKPDNAKGAAAPTGKRLPKKFVVVVAGGVDPELRGFLDANGVQVKYVEPVEWGGLLTFFSIGIVIALSIFMFTFLRRTRDQMMGGGMLGGVTRSPARRYDADDGPKTTFDDVAGLKGVKQDLKEIVEFLRDP
ncbi:MAG: ATP-dependent metallopeptidase FtsH/Yme1/Tma family protein, partial [Planctomycetota bacterium]